MKKVILLFLAASVFSCTKKDVLEQTKTTSYQIRVAAVEDNGTFSYSPTSKVASGKVAVEFETAEVSGIKAYNVEVSTDGTHFNTVKSIPADLHSPDKLYSETIVLP